MKSIHQSTHHKKPKSIGGKTEWRNLRYVHPKLHIAWHYLFKNWSAPVICQVINTIWLDPDYQFVCVRKREEEDPNQMDLGI